MLTLEIAKACLLFAGEGGLRDLSREHVQDLSVGHVAHLVVLLDGLAILVADTAFRGRHEGVASKVVGADIAVQAGPAVVALAFVTLSYWPISATGK